VASAVFNNFQQIGRIKEFDAVDFWRHSFEAGLAAQMLAEKIQLQAGFLFVAGLIHDLGKLVLLIAMPDEYTQILQKSDQPGLDNLAAEKKLTGSTHAEMGKRLFNRWMFQELYLNTTQFHHFPHLAPKDQMATMVVHIADHLAHIAQDNDFLDISLAEETTSAARALGITWDSAGIKKLTRRLSALVKQRAGVMTALFS
jgi:HD-like signal output (HDOD) protein